MRENYISHRFVFQEPWQAFLHYTLSVLNRAAYAKAMLVNDLPQLNWGDPSDHLRCIAHVASLEGDEAFASLEHVLNPGLYSCLWALADFALLWRVLVSCFCISLSLWMFASVSQLSSHFTRRGSLLLSAWRSTMVDYTGVLLDMMIPEVAMLLDSNGPSGWLMSMQLHCHKFMSSSSRSRPM